MYPADPIIIASFSLNFFGKDESFLRKLGAKKIIHRDDFEISEKPLQKQKFSGAIDTVGGKILSTILAQTEYNGTVVCTGMAQSELHVTLVALGLGITIAIVFERHLFQRTYCSSSRSPLLPQGEQCANYPKYG